MTDLQVMEMQIRQIGFLVAWAVGTFMVFNL